MHFPEKCARFLPRRHPFEREEGVGMTWYCDSMKVKRMMTTFEHKLLRINVLKNVQKDQKEFG